MNAATFWCAVVLLRLATTRWRVRRRAFARRAALAVIYIAVPLATLWAEAVRHLDGPCRAVRAGDLCHGLRGRARALDVPAVPPRLAGIALLVLGYLALLLPVAGVLSQ